MYAGDTIAAIATPPGQGGVGIIRVSGPQAAAIGAAIFAASERPNTWISHRLYYGRIRDATHRVLDTALAVLMRAPRSYTGEDVLELHCHGSPVLLGRVLSLVLSCGARLAEPGEFTKRAFLNGRLDLAQAEAVIDMVRARTAAGAALAAAQLDGQLSASIADLRSALIQLKALIEAQIDFSEEDFAVEATESISIVTSCQRSIQYLLDTYRHGKAIRDGLRVAIIGKPNVGKSSLLNALLGEDRAIVTAIAGTTRDVIDETADFDGVPVVLSDTAGLREPEHADTVERIGMQRTTATIAQAGVLLTVLDASLPADERDRGVVAAAAGQPQIVVLNKIDLAPAVSLSAVRQWIDGHPIVAISAKMRTGLAELRSAVVALAAGAISTETERPTLSNIRHVDALTKAAQSLRLAHQSLCEQRPPDLVAVDVQDAIDHIGAVTGAITSEDVLDRVFSEFCIGK